MHHIERRPFYVLREPYDAAEGKILRHRVVNLGHVLETSAALTFQYVVHVHDNLIIFGVDRCDAAFFLQDLENFPDVSVGNLAAPPARSDVGGPFLSP